MELLETKFKSNNKDWVLYPMVLTATSADEYKAGLASIKDRVVGHQFPVVLAAFYPQEHADNDFLAFMTTVLDLVKPMVRVGLMPVFTDRISDCSSGKGQNMPDILSDTFSHNFNQHFNKNTGFSRFFFV